MKDFFGSLFIWHILYFVISNTKIFSRKVPEITALFWLTKLLTTAMGETTSDFLANTISPYVAVAIGFVAFAAALCIQFRTKHYIPWAYWLAVAMVAVFGTMAADVLHKQFGVPYIASTTFYAICLAVIFFVWQKVEHNLSIHSITTARRETFYWLTVMATFAFGTAAGDWTANSLGFGYFSSGILFAGLMLIPVICRRLKISEIFTFWFAYVITRPLGASFADWFGKPIPSGKGFGDGTVSIVLTALIVTCVVFMTINRKEKQAESTLHS